MILTIFFQVVMQNMMNPKTGTAITGGRKLSLTVDGDGCATGTGAEVNHWCANDSSNPNCCTGPGACDNWSADATYTICPGACKGTNSCALLAFVAPAESTVKVGRDACVGEVACGLFAAFSNMVIVEIDIGSQSCNANNACEDVASSPTTSSSPLQITVPSNECSDSNSVCLKCVYVPSDATPNPLFITTQCCQGKGGSTGDSHSECGVAPTPASSAGG